MEESEGGGVPGSSVAVGVAEAGKTLAEAAKGPVLQGDGEDVMVEVLGSHVYVDGVGSEVAAAAGDLQEGAGHSKSGEEGPESKEGAGSVEKRGGIGDERSHDGEPPTVEDAEALRMDKDSAMESEEGLDGGGDLVNGGGGVVNESTSEKVGVVGDHETDALVEGPAVDAKPSGEEGHGLDVDGVDRMVTEESLEGILGDESDERREKSIEGRVDAIENLESQKSVVLDEEAGNSGTGEVADISANNVSSDAPPPVSIEKAPVTMDEESVDPKHEVPGNAVDDGTTLCIERDLISAIDMIHEPREPNVHENSVSLKKEVRLGDGQEDKAEVLHPNTDVVAPSNFEGNLSLSLEDHQENVETVSRSTEKCDDEFTVLEFKSTLIEVSGDDLATMKNKVALSGNDEIVDLKGTVPLSASDQNACSEKHQPTDTQPVLDADEIDGSACACADSEISIKKNQFSDVDHVRGEDSVHSDSDEVMVCSESIQTSKLDAANSKLKENIESSVKQVRVDTTKENRRTSSSSCEDANTVALGQISACSEIEQSLRADKVLEGVVHDNTSEVIMSSMQTLGADQEKMVAAVDTVLDSRAPLNGDNFYSGENPDSRAYMACGSIEENDSLHAERCSHVNQILDVKDDITVTNNVKVSESQVNVLGTDESKESMCSLKDEVPNAIDVDGTTNSVEFVHMNPDLGAPTIDNKATCSSNLTVSGNRDIYDSRNNCKTELQIDAQEQRTAKDEGVNVDTYSSKDVSDPKVDFLECALEENVPSTEKNSVVAMEAKVGSPENDGVSNADTSDVVKPLPVGDQTSSAVGNISDVPQESAMQDKKLETVVTLDHSKSSPRVEESLNQGVAEIPVSVVDSIAGRQAAFSSTHLVNAGDPGSFYPSDAASLLQDGSGGVEVQVVDHRVRLHYGNHAEGSCIDNVERHHDVEDQSLDGKSASTGAGTVGNSAPETILSDSTYTESIKHSGNFKDGNSEPELEVVNNLIAPSDESKHEGSKIQGMHSELSFHVPEGLDENASFQPSDVDPSVGMFAEVRDQSNSINAGQDMESGKQATVSSQLNNSMDDAITGQDVEVGMGIFDTDNFDYCEEQEIQTEEWPPDSEQLKTIEEEIVGEQAEVEEQTSNSEHFSVHVVEDMQPELPTASEQFNVENTFVGQETEVGKIMASELLDWQEISAEEQPAGSEQLNNTEDKVLKRGALKSGGSARLHQASYELPRDPEGEFSVSDLVWGKVRSHPWWPGQIFDVSDSSEKAMKYHKKDCYLVAYFGDRTFAWNDASLLKPFCAYFSQIEKHSSSEAFQNAVDCALSEVSRRVELGLACFCTPEETYNNIKYQIVENTGIRLESSRREGVDKSTSVNRFEPAKLLDYITELAQFPSGGGDRLDLAIVKAQLLAFKRFKGYSRLPEFLSCGIVLEEDADVPSSQDNIPFGEVILSGRGNVKAESRSSHKRKHNLKDSVYPRKRERSLSDLMGGTPISSDSDDGTEGKDTSKLISSSSNKKRKALSSFIDDSTEHGRKNIVFAKVSLTTPSTPRPSFKVGECISRVASQLTRSPSILKCGSDKIVGPDFDVSDQDRDDMGKMIVPVESPTLEEILSQLDLAARDPLRGYSFLNDLISFFYDYRNHVVAYGREYSSMDKPSRGRKRKSAHSMIGSPETFEFDDINDSYWTDRVIQNSPTEQPSRRGRKRRGEHQFLSTKPAGCCLYGNYEIAAARPANDVSPTELVLNFTEGDTVPSESTLNNMFRRFGPLRELETEVDVLTSRARVIFKRCSDAEVAFTSAGTFNIFGSTVVNYELSYSPSTSIKSSSLAITGQEDAV